eukprot:scaffold15892_cov58-Cyclotella_meneghiniana.AAC.1
MDQVVAFGIGSIIGVQTDQKGSRLRHAVKPPALMTRREKDSVSLEKESWSRDNSIICPPPGQIASCRSCAPPCLSMVCLAAAAGAKVNGPTWLVHSAVADLLMLMRDERGVEVRFRRGAWRGAALCVWLRLYANFALFYL